MLLSPEQVVNTWVVRACLQETDCSWFYMGGYNGYIGESKCNIFTTSTTEFIVIILKVWKYKHSLKEVISSVLAPFFNRLVGPIK